MARYWHRPLHHKLQCISREEATSPLAGFHACLLLVELEFAVLVFVDRGAFPPVR